jgi:hypothetical protein
MIESRGVSSVPGPVVNVSEFLSDPPATGRFRSRFVSALAETLGGGSPLVLSGGQWQQVASLARRYRSWQWTWGRCPRFVQDADLCLEGAKNRVRLTVEGGTVVHAAPAEQLSHTLPDLTGRRYDDLLMHSGNHGS